MNTSVLHQDLFHGSLVHLTHDNLDVVGKAFSRWNRDSEYLRLLDDNPEMLWSPKKIQEWVEKELEKDLPSEFIFQIHTLENDFHIGFIGLFEIDWVHSNTWVGIGLGERDYWGKGYGTDAMKVILCYAFTELNMQRVTLGVFEYNPRGVKSYEKAGFKLEGRLRQALARDGKRYDIYIMGILKNEWDLQKQM